MPQFVGSVRDDRTVRDLLVSVAQPRIREAAQAVDAAELAIMTRRRRGRADGVRAGAQRLGRGARLRGRDASGTCAPRPRSASRTRRRSGAQVRTLSGGEQKRLVLEALLRGTDEVLLLDEPDNYLDVPGKRWLEEQLAETRKTVLFVSHDRELLARAAREDRQRRAEPGGQRRVGARRRLRHVPRGPQGALRALRGAAAALGRGARPAEEAGAATAAAGRDQPRHGVALPRRRRPGCGSSRRPGRRRSRRASRTSRCGCAAAAPACGR